MQSEASEEVTAQQIQQLLEMSFKPREVVLHTDELKPFIPDFIPALGELPCGLDPEPPAIPSPWRPRHLAKCKWRGAGVCRRRCRSLARPWECRGTRACCSWQRRRGCRAFARWLRSAAGRAVRRRVSRWRRCKARSEQRRRHPGSRGTIAGAELPARDAQSKDGIETVEAHAVEHALDLETMEGALECFFEFMAVFLVEYKEQALRSTFLEPMKFYYDAVGMPPREVQSVATWARGLLQELGLEEGASSTASPPDVWSCLSQDVWEEFTLSRNLGLGFQQMELQGVAVSAKQPQTMSEETKCRLLCTFAGHFGLQLVDKAAASWDADVQRAVETLHRCFCEELQLPLGPLHPEALQRLFAWLGVLRRSSAMVLQQLLEPRRDACPICFEEQPDVELLEHWQSKGDISEHRMCGACRREYGQRAGAPSARRTC
ncbi:unnamed protein product [Effrenium voratum]|nr:unnamed protein product [Effrenium voratum]